MHNPLDETHRASCLRENLTSSSYGEGLETDGATTHVTALLDDSAGHKEPAILTLEGNQLTITGHGGVGGHWKRK